MFFSFFFWISSFFLLFNIMMQYLHHSVFNIFPLHSDALTPA